MCMIVLQYNTEVMEMVSNKEILRIGVTDKDTPNTPGSRAVFTILKGNEERNYKIDTDPKTNEGVLYVIKVSAIICFNLCTNLYKFCKIKDGIWCKGYWELESGGESAGQTEKCDTFLLSYLSLRHLNNSSGLWGEIHEKIFPIQLYFTIIP